MEMDGKNCFIIMPISDPPDYAAGHFSRVYKHLIKPACEKSGLNPVRADDVQKTNFIIIDILKRILSAPVAVCDLSSRNPNVLYELGIRHSFNLPVVLIKDTETPRVFDVQGLRTLDYDQSLRVDSVQNDVDQLSVAISTTIGSTDGINSIIQLLGITKAEITNKSSISPETAILLDGIREIGHRLTALEESGYHQTDKMEIRPQLFMLPCGEEVRVGEMLLDGSGGPKVGELIGLTDEGVIVMRNGEPFVIPPDDDLSARLTTIPF